MGELVGLQSIPEEEELLSVPEDEELLSGPAACVRRMSQDSFDYQYTAPTMSSSIASQTGAPSTGSRSPSSSPVLSSTRKGKRPASRATGAKSAISSKESLAEAISSVSARKCPPTLYSNSRTKSSRHEYAKWTESLEKSGKRPHMSSSVPKNLLKKELCITRLSSCSTSDIVKVRRMYMKGHEWMPKSARIELPSPPLEMKSPESILSPGRRDDGSRRRSMFTMKVTEAVTEAAAAAASMFSPRKSISAPSSDGSPVKSPVESISAGPSLHPSKPQRCKIRDSFEIDSWDLDDDLPLIDAFASPIISKDVLEARAAKEEEIYATMVGPPVSSSRKTSTSSSSKPAVESMTPEKKSTIEAFLSKSPRGVLDAALQWSKIAPPAMARRRITSKPLTGDNAREPLFDTSFLSNRQILIAGVLGLYVVLVIYYLFVSQ